MLNKMSNMNNDDSYQLYILMLKEKQMLKEKHVQQICKLAISESKHNTEILKSNNNINNMCTVCMSTSRDSVYIKCGHLCACSNCCQYIGNKCPICKCDSAYVKIIYS